MIEKAIPVGGGAANFRVVGGNSEPSNPRANTIWVNTSTPISDFVVSDVAPEQQEGRVWVCASLSGAHQFNAVRKNGIILNPYYCMICSNNAWQIVESSIYQNGSWNAVSKILFRDGDVASNSGGWTAGGSATTVQTIGGTLNITQRAAGTPKYYIVSGQQIDLTPYSTLTFKVSGTCYAESNSSIDTLANRRMVVGFDASASNTAARSMTGAVDIFLDGETSVVYKTFTIDIREITGSYFIKFLCDKLTSTTNNYLNWNISVYEIFLQ